MSEEVFLKAIKYIVIRNSISLICFTILAIVFKIWWLVFFAILFLMYIPKEYMPKENGGNIDD